MKNKLEIMYGFIYWIFYSIGLIFHIFCPKKVYIYIILYDITTSQENQISLVELRVLVKTIYIYILEI